MSVFFLRFSANMMRLSFCKHSVNVRNDYTVAQKFNNFDTATDNEMPFGIFMRT